METITPETMLPTAQALLRSLNQNSEAVMVVDGDHPGDTLDLGSGVSLTLTEPEHWQTVAVEAGTATLPLPWLVWEEVYSHGGREEPPSSDVVDVGRYAGPWEALREAVLLIAAKSVDAAMECAETYDNLFAEDDTP